MIFKIKFFAHQSCGKYFREFLNEFDFKYDSTLICSQKFDFILKTV